MQNHNGVTASIDTRPGAVTHITYMERAMKGYCVFESDLKHLTFLNTWATFLFSGGSFSLAIVASILTAWVMQLPSVELSKIAILLLIIFGVMTALCYVFAIWMITHQKSYWKEIGSNSKEVTKDGKKQ
jgi:hypothetical protein